MTGITYKAKERRQEILIAAQRLFHTKGFQETSISDIMKAVGAAKGVFYYYFKTKDQVLDTLVDQNISEIADAMVQAVNRTDVSPIQKLQLMLQGEFRVSMESMNAENHLHNIKNVDMHQKIMVGLTKRVAPLIGQVVEQGVLSGAFTTKYPLEAAELLITGIHFITDLGIFEWSKEQYIERLRASEELIEKVLGVEEGSFHYLSEMLMDTPDRVKHKS
jgi:AcrR family transcriptional regulator